MPSNLGIVASGITNDTPGGVRFSAVNQRYTRASFGIGSTSLTVAFWAKLAVNTATYSFGVSVDNAASNYVQVGAGNTGVNISVSGTTGGITSGANMTVGTWTYMALAWNSAAGSNDLLYWAFAPATTLNTSAPSTVTGFNTANALWIAADGFGVNFFNGSIAALKFWTAILAKAELETEMTKYAAQRTSNLYASYEFDAGPQTADDSGNSRTLTAGAGTATLEPSGPPCT